MVNRQIDAMAELQNAFQVLMKNLVLAVPTALASLILGAFMLFFVAAAMATVVGAGAMTGLGTGTSHPGLGALLAGGSGLMLLLGFALIIVIMVLAQAIVMAGAERVWHGEPADLSHGISRAMGKLPPLIMLFILGGIVFAICGVLIFVGWIAAVVLAFLFMFTVPAIVVGNEGVTQALGTSYRLVRSNMNACVMAFLGVLVVTIIGAVISNLFLHVPALGLIVQLIVGGLTSAYAALVAVRFYDLLRGQAA